MLSKVNIPNLLTWLRIALIPLLIIVFYLPANWLKPEWINPTASLIFLVAGITDWLDGYLARKLDQTSVFGAFLDPVADKLMVATALIMLVDLSRVSPIIASVIIGREITISALREWMAQIGATQSVAVNYLGKLKTACQMVAIFLLFLYDHFWGKQLGTFLIYVATVLTLWSMIYYLKSAKNQ